MTKRAGVLARVRPAEARPAQARPAEADSDHLDLVFAALSDPIRRSILERLDGNDLLVSELAAAYAISIQAVSRHIHVLVHAGLITQTRSGRVSRCSLDAGPIAEAAVWINRYSKYWDAQFQTLADQLLAIEERRAKK